MPKQKAKVIEAFPNAFFDLENEKGEIIRCYISGKLRVRNINIRVGDSVEYELPDGSKIGRITRRYDQKETKPNPEDIRLDS